MCRHPTQAALPFDRSIRGGHQDFDQNSKGIGVREPDQENVRFKSKCQSNEVDQLI